MTDRSALLLSLGRVPDDGKAIVGGWEEIVRPPSRNRGEEASGKEMCRPPTLDRKLYPPYPISSNPRSSA